MRILDQWNDLGEQTAFIDNALRASVTDTITPELIEAVRTAAVFTASNDTTQITPESVRSAIGTVILAEGLTPRDALLASILSRLAALEAS